MTSVHEGPGVSPADATPAVAPPRLPLPFGIQRRQRQVPVFFLLLRTPRGAWLRETRPSCPAGALCTLAAHRCTSVSGFRKTVQFPGMTQMLPLHEQCVRLDIGTLSRSMGLPERPC